MRVGYIIKSHGHTIENIVYFKDICSVDEDDKKELIRDACEYAWDHDDGWEWLRDDEVITLIVDGIEQGDFPVEVRSEPVFIVHEQKE